MDRTLFLGLLNKFLNVPLIHPFDGRQRFPLVRVRVEVFIHEDRVAWGLLRRQIRSGSRAR